MAVKRSTTSKARRSRAKPKAKARERARTPKSKARVTVTLKFQVWLDPRDGKIRIVAPGHFISTVSDRPGKRMHKHLFSKLKAVLKKRGRWFEIR